MITRLSYGRRFKFTLWEHLYNANIDSDFLHKLSIDSKTSVSISLVTYLQLYTPA